MRMINTIFLLVFCSLMLGGCIGEAEPENVSEEAEEAPPGEGALPEEEAPPAEPEEEAPPEEEPAEAQWGDECTDNYDCSWDDKEACEYGYCVVQECFFTSECSEDKDHCFVGNCYTEAELYAEFPECALDVACEETCDGCTSGKRNCITTGHSEGDVSVDYRICAECISDSRCIEGYVCVDAFCVPGPES